MNKLKQLYHLGKGLFKMKEEEDTERKEKGKLLERYIYITMGILLIPLVILVVIRLCFVENPFFLILEMVIWFFMTIGFGVKIITKGEKGFFFYAVIFAISILNGIMCLIT